MENKLIAALTEYHFAIMIGVLALLLLLPRKKYGKMALVATAALALSIIYELVMDEPVSRIPGRIDRYLNQPGPTESTNPNYYAPPEERLVNPEDRKYLPVN